MNSKPRISYTRSERRLKAAWDRVLNDPSATPGQLALAARGLERLAARATRRAKNRPPAPDPVEALVRQFEAAHVPEAEKPPLQPIAGQGLAEPQKPLTLIEPAVAPPTAPTVPEVTETQIQQIQPSDPIRPRQRSWLYEKGTDENIFDLSAVFPSAARSDLEKSAQLWRQMDDEVAEKAAQDRREREAAEAQFHAARADYISRGGRL